MILILMCVIYNLSNWLYHSVILILIYHLLSYAHLENMGQLTYINIVILAVSSILPAMSVITL